MLVTIAPELSSRACPTQAVILKCCSARACGGARDELTADRLRGAAIAGCRVCQMRRFQCLLRRLGYSCLCIVIIIIIITTSMTTKPTHLALGEDPQRTQLPRVVVTGGSGKLGRATIDHLANVGWEVISFDVRRPPGAAEDGKTGIGGAYRLVEVDLTDMGSVLEALMEVSWRSLCWRCGACAGGSILPSLLSARLADPFSTTS